MLLKHFKVTLMEVYKSDNDENKLRKDVLLSNLAQVPTVPYF